METKRVRKEREKGHRPPFKDMTQNCSHDFHSRLTGQALLTRSHLPTREVGKYHLYLCDRVPGFCLWEREWKWLLKDNQQPWWEGWVETVGKQKFLPWECQKGCSCGVEGWTQAIRGLGDHSPVTSLPTVRFFCVFMIASNRMYSPPCSPVLLRFVFNFELRKYSYSLFRWFNWLITKWANTVHYMTREVWEYNAL